LIIGLVAWLANRETTRSLARARISEHALELERDNLEVKVAERTRELEQAQLVRVMELQRLAEFGRLSAGLLHEMSNPLTVASLNLEQHSSEPRPVLLRRAVQSLQHIERFVDAARKQLKGQGNLTNFSLHQEVKQVTRILGHRAREGGVKFEIISDAQIRLFGDPVKFNQLIANLLINSIEAYDDHPTPFGERRVVITIKRTEKTCQVQVCDWGHGLSADEKQHIFEPFYSTKQHNQQNMGIGLAMVQQIVTADFMGRITVTSSPKRGTCFTVKLRSQTKPSS
jgi:two-component system C4-dicarboxylate transport sensor histidine kinase DctB